VREQYEQAERGKTEGNDRQDSDETQISKTLF